MKSKLTITIASILSVLVLVGVGFAAWVIINPNVGANADGNIEVDTVTDNSYEIKADFVKTTDDATNGTIVFGKKDDSTITTPWLTNTEKAEKLTATLTLTAHNFQAGSWDTIKTKTLIVSMQTIKNSTEDNTGFDSLVTSKYITYPTLSGAGSVSKTLTKWTDTVEIPLSVFTDGTDGTKTYALTIQFAWGDHFKNTDGTVENPYVFYNKKTYADAKADANTALKAIHDALNGVSYKVSIKEQAAQA